MKKITYYFIKDNLDFELFKDIVKKKKINLSNLTAVLWDNSYVTFFEDNNIKYLLKADYSKKINFNLIREKLLQLMKNFPHKKILSGKSLVELLEYNGYSLWWFIRQGFYANILMVIREVSIIRCLIAKNNIKRICLLTANKEFISIVKEAAKTSKIIMDKNDKSDTIFIAERIKNLILGSVPRIIRIFQGFFRSFSIKKNNGRKNILLFTQDWTQLGENIKGDPNSYTILRNLLQKKNYNVLPLENARNKNSQWKSIREKKKPFVPYDYFLFKSYFDIEIRENIGLYRQRLSILWDKLEKNNTLKRLLNYDSIDLYSILRPRIKSYFFSRFNSFLGAARNIETSKKLIKDYKIDATICIDENGHSRFLVFTSHMSKIPSIAVQHGIFLPYNISYNYSKEDIYSYSGNLNCILADKTAVFGVRSRNMLIKNGNYNPKRIVVTGHPRTDIFVGNKSKYSRKRMCEKLGISYNKKLVVYASQPYRDTAEQKIALAEIVASLRALKNVELIVKMHPEDDSSFYCKILSDLDFKAVVTKDADLYTLLLFSDLVISIASTVIIEALIMHKPVIQLNLLENYAFLEQLEGKIFTKITKKADLHKAIKSALYDKSLFRKMEKQRKKFISDYYFKIDGKATERFIGVLDGLVKNRKE